MKAKIDLGFRSLVLLSALAILASCNLYSKFGSTGSDEAKIEEALHCLHDGNYACAIENYTALADTTERAKRLCQVNLARAGLTLSVLINTLGSNTGNSDVLGKVANAVIPWTQEKQTAVEAAATPCDTYFAVDTAAQYGKVLLGLSAIMNCAVGMAKSDQFVATSSADTACTTAGNGDGVVTPADISDQTDGTITTKGMCSADVTACRDRLVTVSSATGGDANIDQVVGGVGANSGLTSDGMRGVLRTKTAN